MSGLWRYISDYSNRIYVFYRSEIERGSDHISVNPFDRDARVYIEGKPSVIPMKDVVVYLVTHEKEMHFDDSTSFMINMNLIVHRRGWGVYVHLFDSEMNIHAFKLKDSDVFPDNIPHLLDTSHIGNTKGSVELHGDAYEDEIVTSDGEYVKQGVFYPATALSMPKPGTIFYDQDGKIRKYRSKDARQVSSMFGNMTK